MNRREYYLKNKEQENKKSREYYQNNKERCKMVHNEWKLKNPNYEKEWRIENNEKHKKQIKEWKSKHKDKVISYTMNWRARNPEKVKVNSNASKYYPIKESCEYCGSKYRLQRHHPDYSQPDKIITLCANCHVKTYNRKVEEIYVV